ncbi:MAG: hypothetical protein INR63_17925 [Actinomycetospora chiangmaiensis]|nr:hypothetical protein [Actinomycetospora chiangmaiensis]
MEPVMPRVIPHEALAYLRGTLGPEGVIGITVTGVEQTAAGPGVRFDVPRLRRRRGDTRRLPERDMIAELVSRMVALRWFQSVEPRPVPQDSSLTLMDQHPQIYDGPTETGPGWHWLLTATALWIEEVGVPQGWVADQVKEKFGTLRFYAHSDDEPGRVGRIIAAAEWVSGAVCETCGAPGSTRAGGYVRTACDAHAETRRG